MTKATPDKARGYLLIEVLVSLAIVSVGFSSFLGVFSAVRQHHARLQHRTAATLLVQSVLEQVRAGQLAQPLATQSWTRLGDHGFAHPAAPALYPLEPGGHKYFWQLTAGELPQPGRLCTLNAIISWAERNRHEQVSVSTQFYLP